MPHALEPLSRRSVERSIFAYDLKGAAALDRDVAKDRESATLCGRRWDSKSLTSFCGGVYGITVSSVLVIIYELSIYYSVDLWHRQ